MTNEELLQQAKDQMAENTGRFKDWKHVLRSASVLEERELSDAAAVMAIQSAREEAAPKYTSLLEARPETGQLVIMSRNGQFEHIIQYHPSYPASSYGDTHWMYVPKLTAPGR